MRTFSAAVQTANARDPRHTCHLLSIVVGATTYRYTDGDAIQFAGFAWSPKLVFDSPVRLSEKLQLDPVSLKVLNVDQAFAAILKLEQPDVQGATATLYRYFLTADEAVILFLGPVTAIPVDEDDVTMVLGGDLDPTASTVPKRKYLSVSSEDGRTFDEWDGDGNKELFDGFLTITRELTEAVEGQLPDAAPDDRALASLYE